MTTLVDILKTIANAKSLVLFNTIANGDTRVPLELTRKQYYSRLSALIKVGVVERVSGKYSVTTCGAILYHVQELIGKAVKQYWELEAIDSISVSGNDDLSQQEFYLIIDKLITNQEIKNILLKHYKGEPSVS